MNDAAHKESQLTVSLLALRLGVFIVFLMWTLDKMFNYEHSSGVMLHYYHLQVPEWLIVSLGLIELVLLVGFLFGVLKTFTYGFILLAHLVTTIASSWRLLPPYEVHQLLYFGSLPMLAACFALFLLRERDLLLNFSILARN